MVVFAKNTKERKLREARSFSICVLYKDYVLVFENGNAAEHEKQQPMSKASVLAVEGLNKSRKKDERSARH